MGKVCLCSIKITWQWIFSYHIDLKRNERNERCWILLLQPLGSLAINLALDKKEKCWRGYSTSVFRDIQNLFGQNLRQSTVI